MDRRAIAEENYRKKFDELGLSERFEFIRREWSIDHDKRFWSRCRTCGAEFLSWGGALTGKQKRHICPECGAASDGNDIFTRSKTAQEAAELYVQGLTYIEIADRLNISIANVGEAVKSLDVTDPSRKMRCSEVANRNRRASAEKRITEHLLALGFDYLGGYSDKHGKVKVRCQKCGSEYERTVNHLRKGNVVCAECQKRETEKRNEERRRIAAQQAEVRKMERDWYRLMHPPKDERKEALLNQSGVCEICGKTYIVKEYVESCGMNYARNNGVCSGKCRRIKLNRIGRESRKRRGVQDGHRHRARKYGGNYDPSVTLKKLVIRDGLRCAICGGMCDWNDHSWSKYSGPMYPSIDHIIPMSKGGGHVWENVQVAHIICNSEKGDKVERGA